MKKSNISKYLYRFYAFIIFAFMYAPIALLIVYSFNESRISSSWSGFTLGWYAELFADAQILNSIYYTIILAILSSSIAVLIGTFAAIKIKEMPKIKRLAIMNVNSLPILNPDIVTAIALMTLFLFFRMERGFTTMLLAHLTFNIPFVVLSVLPKLDKQAKDLMEAAIDLGATYTYAFRKVLIPHILPGVITGWLISFTMSIDDFVISFFASGNGVSNLSIYIYSMTKRGFTPKINAISTLMFISVLILLLLVNKLQDKGDATLF